MWKKLAIDKPKKQQRYKVMINKTGRQFEDSLYWTGKPALWEDLKVEYWFDEDERR